MIYTQRLIAIIGLSFFLAGCAGKTATYNLDYTIPEKTIINNEVIVTSNYDETWSDLVGEMSKSFYVINNIDKESRLINLSFSPVSLGHSSRTIKISEFIDFCI